MDGNAIVAFVFHNSVITFRHLHIIHAYSKYKNALSIVKHYYHSLIILS